MGKTINQRYQYLLFDIDNTLMDFTAGEKTALFQTMDELGIAISEADYQKYLEINKAAWSRFEMGELDRFLAEAPVLLSPGGRIAVISYHSLEDRRVKRAFRSLAQSGEHSLPVRKAIAPTDAEIEKNPRARSAKLRILERTI